MNNYHKQVSNTSMIDHNTIDLAIMDSPIMNSDILNKTNSGMRTNIMESIESVDNITPIRMRVELCPPKIIRKNRMFHSDGNYIIDTISSPYRSPKKINHNTRKRKISCMTDSSSYNDHNLCDNNNRNDNHNDNHSFKSKKRKIKNMPINRFVTNSNNNNNQSYEKDLTKQQFKDINNLNENERNYLYNTIRHVFFMGKTFSEYNQDNLYKKNFVPLPDVLVIDIYDNEMISLFDKRNVDINKFIKSEIKCLQQALMTSMDYLVELLNNREIDSPINTHINDSIDSEYYEFVDSIKNVLMFSADAICQELCEQSVRVSMISNTHIKQRIRNIRNIRNTNKNNLKISEFENNLDEWINFSLSNDITSSNGLKNCVHWKEHRNIKGFNINELLCDTNENKLRSDNSQNYALYDVKFFTDIVEDLSKCIVNSVEFLLKYLCLNEDVVKNILSVSKYKSKFNSAIKLGITRHFLLNEIDESYNMKSDKIASDCNINTSDIEIVCIVFKN